MPSKRFNLPSIVSTELKNLSPEWRQAFHKEHKLKSKSIITAYIFHCLLLGTHYAYVGKWVVQIVYWLTIPPLLIGLSGLILTLLRWGGSLSYGFYAPWAMLASPLTLIGIWAIIDLFRIPGMIDKYNRDAATEVMKSLKEISKGGNRE